MIVFDLYQGFLFFTRLHSIMFGMESMPNELPPGELPRVIPVFPLAGVILLPHAMMPLHIFEPRYVNMVNDALAGDKIIGMVQPKSIDDEPQPELYDTGCAGRIVEHTELEDGRYLITLEGVCRFRITKELQTTSEPYRIVEADCSPFAADVESGGITLTNRQQLITAIRDHLGRIAANIDLSRLEKLSDEQLVNGGAMLAPFTPPEKQALLEAPTLKDRAQILMALLDMDGAEPGAPIVQ